jgi:hypothetical protein
MNSIKSLQSFMEKKYKTDEPCGPSQLRNPEANKKTGRHHCKECSGFGLDELEKYAKKIGIQVERGDRKKDLCEKIFERVGLRGQNVFDKIVSGAIGIPTAVQAAGFPFVAPGVVPHAAHPAFPAAPLPPMIRKRLTFRPVITTADKPAHIKYPPQISQLFLDGPEYNTLEEAVDVLSRNLYQLLQILSRAGIELYFEQTEKRHLFPYDYVLQTVKPAAENERQQSFIMIDKNKVYGGKLQFNVARQEVPEEVKITEVEEQLTADQLLRMALGEIVEEPTKKRGLGK